MSTARALTVLADDLSGAAETAAAFLGRRPAPVLALDPDQPHGTGVTVVDLDSRSRPAPDADRTLSSALDAVPPDRMLMYKVDSLLRGHVGAAVDRLARRGPVLLAAGLPALNRLVRDGALHVDGVPLHLTDLWQLESSAAPQTIAELLGCPARDRLSPADVTATVAQGAVAVCDVTCDADLDAAVRVALANPQIQLVGTSALASALARTLPAAETLPYEGEQDLPSAPALVVVGTGVATATDQVAALRGHGAVPLELSVEDLLAGSADITSLSRLLSVHPVVVVTLQGSTSAAHRGALAEALGWYVGAAEGAAAARPDLVLTGGETARAVIDALGIGTLQPTDVIHHGAVLSHTPEGRRIVTRPGSFGDRDSFVQIIDHLASAPKPAHRITTDSRNPS